MDFAQRSVTSAREGKLQIEVPLQTRELGIRGPTLHRALGLFVYGDWVNVVILGRVGDRDVFVFNANEYLLLDFWSDAVLLHI